MDSLWAHLRTIRRAHLCDLTEQPTHFQMGRLLSPGGSGRAPELLFQLLHIHSEVTNRSFG